MNSRTPHPFTPNPMRGGQYNWAECGDCRMPLEHQVHEGETVTVTAAQVQAVLDEGLRTGAITPEAHASIRPIEE